LYLLANLAYVIVLPLGAIQNAESNRVGTAAMQAIFGPTGKIIMAIAIMISTFGCNNGLILAGARVYYAMARDNLFFKRVGTVNSKHVPAVALITQGIWAAFLTLPRTATIDAKDRQSSLRKCLYSVDRISDFGRHDFLWIDGGRRNCDAAKGARSRKALSNVRLSARAPNLYCAGFSVCS
jgi:hypothetical protein